MREIKPYKTLQGARRALDKSGRIYNLLARSGDDIIDTAELTRAAGVYSTGTKAFLHFEMALMALPPDEQQQIVSSLSPKSLERFKSNRPSTLAPSSVETKGQAGDPTIVSGYPIFVEDKTQFTGYIVIIVPVVILIPIFDQFDVYEVFDSADLSTPRTVTATTRGSKRLDGTHTRFAGVLKELYFEDKTSKDHGLYLESIYYTRLQSVSPLPSLSKDEQNHRVDVM
jgi:hypothetical protein